MRFALIAITSLFLLGGARLSSAESGDTAKWGQVEGWEIRVDRSVGDGCFAMQVYEDNTVLRVGFDQTEKAIYLFIANASWKSVEIGKRYQMRFVFDEQYPFNGELVGVKLGNLTVLSHSNVSTDFTKAFMQRNGLRVYYQNNRIASLSLKNTYAAIGEVLNCQSAMASSGSGKGRSQTTSDPFSNSPTNDPFR